MIFIIKKIFVFVIILVTLLMFIGCEKTNTSTGLTNNSTKIEEEAINTATSEKNKDNQTENDKEASGGNKKHSIEEDTLKEIVQEEVLLTLNDKGNEVLKLQKSLFNIGFDLKVDGIYGGQTTTIIEKIQKNNSLLESGNYNKKTKGVLEKIDSVRNYDEIVKEIEAKKKAEAEAEAKAEAKAEAEAKAKAEAEKKEEEAKEQAQNEDTEIQNNILTSIPDIKTNPENSEQVLVVLADRYGTQLSTYAAYEKVNGGWKKIYSGKSVLGKNGFNDNRREGDKTTPTGKYGVPFMFGTASNPGVKFEYRLAKEGDYWASNNILEEYNVWLHYDGDDPVARMGDFEALWKIKQYKYAAVIDFNYYSNKQIGKGSAIFLHIWKSSTYGTAGCVAMSEPDLLKVLKWLNPAKKPTIIMGVKGHI